MEKTYTPSPSDKWRTEEEINKLEKQERDKESSDANIAIKVNAIKWVQKLFWGEITEIQIANSSIDSILDIVSKNPRKVWNFSEKLQSNYKHIIENHNTWNCKIIKSIKYYLDNKIELTLEHDKHTIKFIRNIDDKWKISYRSLYIDEKLYKFDLDNDMYIDPQTQNTIPQKYINLIKNIQILPN